MPNIILYIGAALLGLKDVFKGVFADKAGKILVIGVVSYFILKHFFDKAASDIAAGNSATIGNPEEFATRLYDALIPSGNEYLNDWLGDGSDEAAIQQIAIEMKPLRNFSAVTYSYKALFNRDLVKDLSSDSVYALFKQYYN